MKPYWKPLSTWDGATDAVRFAIVALADSMKGSSDTYGCVAMVSEGLGVHFLTGPRYGKNEAKDSERLVESLTAEIFMALTAVGFTVGQAETLCYSYAYGACISLGFESPEAINISRRMVEAAAIYGAGVLSD